MPTIKPVYVAKKIKRLTLDIKPDTTIEHIKMIWNQIDNYQKQMTASQRIRVRSSNNFDRDFAIYYMVKYEKMTFTKAIDAWNKKNSNNFIQTGNSAIQLAVRRLDELFKPHNK